MQTIDDENKGYALAQSELTEQLTQQMKKLRGRLNPTPSACEPLDETDRLFAAQMATNFLEMSLRPTAVRGIDEICKLVSASTSGHFKTGIEPDEFVRMIAETGAILRGHFLLLSGRHSDYFFMFSRLAARLAFRKKLAVEIAKRFDSMKIDSVIAPITAGGLLVQDVANELDADFAFFDVDEHSRPFAIRRGYSVHGSTLIVNDMTTTGEGIKEMLKILHDTDAKLKGIGLIATRGALGREIVNNLIERGHNVQVLFHLHISAFEKDKCDDTLLRRLPIVSSVDINR